MLKRSPRSVAALMAAGLIAFPAIAEDMNDGEPPSAAADGTPAAEPAASDPMQIGEAMDADASPMADQALGKTFNVRPEDLPEPYASEAVRNAAVILDREGRQPNVPEGFSVTLFAENLKPRQALAMEDGGVIVAEQATGKLMYLEDTTGDGSADVIQLFAQGFEQPYGLADDGEDGVLVADVRGIWRVPTAGATAVRAGGRSIYAPQPAADVPKAERHPQTPMTHFPVTDQGVFGGSQGHSTRSLFRDEQAGTLYVGVGSAGNIGIEPKRRATVQAFDADGSNQRTVMVGVRNPINFDEHPETGELWVTVQERDGLGNELVPDFMAPVEEGADYGYPHAYTGSNPQPDFAEREPSRVEASQVPPVLFEAHSAAMSFAFYDGDSFPEEYYGDAFVPLKGSWNRADPTGYKVVRVHFEDGEPTGTYENFMTGFWVSGDARAEVWGRPADVDVMPDGSLLVVDDTGGTIWRVTYTGGPS